ncbi:MAG TPA: hypothetical protein VK498_11040, partial [Ferruginibacter sp.]|nr:hypothetical protein [Ferruginibacter sp.]
MAVIGNGSSGIVFVNTPSGILEKPGFIYTGPSINNYTPTGGVSGTSVQINGSNFTGTTSVSIGGVPVTSFIVDFPSRITAIIPSNVSG